MVKPHNLGKVILHSLLFFELFFLKPEVISAQFCLPSAYVRSNTAQGIREDEHEKFFKSPRKIKPHHPLLCQFYQPHIFAIICFLYYCSFYSSPSPLPCCQVARETIKSRGYGEDEKGIRIPTLLGEVYLGYGRGGYTLQKLL